MATHNKPAANGRLFVAALACCTSAGIAIVLLVAALVIGLSELLGSFTWSALLAGGVFALLAAGIYLFSLKEPLEQIRTRIETVYDVARLLKQGYDWVREKLDFFVRLKNELWRNTE